MCGIHGFISGKKADINADDFLSSGFVAGSLRGMDSSGIAAINTQTSAIEYQKLPIPGTHFISDKTASELIKAGRTINQVSICHTRAATQGKVGYSTAHPFLVCDDKSDRELIGVHNGTLLGWGSKKYGNRYTVDSEWALNHLFDNGIEAFKDFNGAYCLVWYDTEDKGQVNIALNSERPMHIALTETGNVAFASEAGMLYWLLERHKIKISDKILELTPGHWYKFPVDEPTKFTKKEVPKASYTTTTTYNNTNYQTSYQGNRYNNRTIMSKVDDLLKKIGSSEEAKPDTSKALTTVITRRLSVTKSETEDARDLKIYLKKVIFEPHWLDTDGTMQGMAYFEDESESPAEIRNADHLDFNATTRWNCSVIGAFADTGKDDIVLVCGKPKSEVMPKKKAATMH